MEQIAELLYNEAELEAMDEALCRVLGPHTLTDACAPTEQIKGTLAGVRIIPSDKLLSKRRQPPTSQPEQPKRPRIG